MPRDNVYRTYARLLKYHNKGHALLEPIRADKIALGSVGYFDSKGRWETVLENITTVNSLFEPYMEDIENISEDSEASRDFASKNFAKVDFKLESRASGSAINIPLSAEMAVQKFQLDEATAFLHCQQLSCKRIKSRYGAIKKWGKGSAGRILSTNAATRKYGFFVVMAVHCAQSCQLKCWAAEKHYISTGISGDSSVTPIGLQLKGEIDADSIANSGWIIRPPNDSMSMGHEYIVFIEGYLFVSYVYGLVTTVTEDEVVWRGNETFELEGGNEESADETDVELEDDDQVYRVVCEEWAPKG